MRAMLETKNPCGKSLHSALRIGRPKLKLKKRRLKEKKGIDVSWLQGYLLIADNKKKEV
jgi:hypothetical protein